MILSERDEKIYEAGQRSAWRTVLRESLMHLEPQERAYAVLVEERNAALVVLRRLCEEFGDNNWSDNLDLADILDKHLCKHLWKT